MENRQVMANGTAIEKFTWKIEAFSKLKTKKLSSKAFKTGGHRWKIVLYPKGRDGVHVGHLSLYMKVADSLPPYGWSRFAYFKMALINQLDSNKSIVKETQQKFNAGNIAWGSPSFIPLKEFHDLGQGYLVNDTCIIEAHVSVSKVAFDVLNNNLPKPKSITTTHESNADQLKLKEVDEEVIHQQEEDQGMEPTDLSVTLSPTSTHDSKDYQDCESEVLQLLEKEHTSDATSSPKKFYFVPSAPPLYPSLSSESEEVLFLTPLNQLIDYKSLEPEEAAFVPLLEEVCSLHPSLIENQRKRSPRFILWAFTALGRVLLFLKTKKIKDMDEYASMHLKILWEELESFGFDLAWLKPHVESAFCAKAYLERAEQVKNLRFLVHTSEIEVRKMKAKLAIAKVDLEVARKDLEEVEKGFKERDVDAELGYGIN